MSISDRRGRIEVVAQSYIGKGAYSSIEWFVKKDGETWDLPAWPPSMCLMRKPSAAQTVLSH